MDLTDSDLVKVTISYQLEFFQKQSKTICLVLTDDRCFKL